MVEVEARIVGGIANAGLGSVFLQLAQDCRAADLIRLGVTEQIRELVAKRRLSQGEAILALRRQYQADGSLPSLPHDGRLDPARETERALAAFAAGACLLFVDGEQIHDLNELVTLETDTKVQFLRLVPLAGG